VNLGCVFILTADYGAGNHRTRVRSSESEASQKVSALYSERKRTTERIAIAAVGS